MKNAANCPFAEGFGFWEKVWAQVSFLGMGTVGTAGILLADWIWVFPYVVVYWYGIPGVVMRHTNCPRCTHLHEFGDCLQAPPALSRWLVKEKKDWPFTGVERVLFLGIFLFIPIYPTFWLVQRPFLLIVFLASAGAWYGGQLFRFCKQCRVTSCPFNRAPMNSQV